MTESDHLTQGLATSSEPNDPVDPVDLPQREPQATEITETPWACIPIEIWHTIGECLPWPQALLLSNSCTLLVPLRHALDQRLQHLLTPNRVAEGILRYRIEEGSKHLKALITKDGRRNSRALSKEVEKGMGIIAQWWKYEPPGIEGYRQPQHIRHSDLGYAVLRSVRSGLRRYWRFRAITRLSGASPLEKAYRELLMQWGEEMLAERKR